MKYREREELMLYVKQIDLENQEQLLYMFNYFLEAVFNSLVCFGLTHEITKDAIRLFKEFRANIIEERFMHRYMLDQSVRIEADECFKLLDKLDILNEKTVNYYYGAFDDILSACSTNFSDRTKHNKRDFKILIENDFYKRYLEGLTLTLRDIKCSLNYEEEFWDFVDDKTVILNSKIDKRGCGIDRSGDEVKIFVPLIINLETANINKKIFSEVYEKIYMKRVK